MLNLKEMRAAAVKAAREIVDAAKAEDREITPEENETIAAKMAEVKDLDKKIQGKALVDSVLSLGTVEDNHDEPAAAKSLGEHFAKTAGDRLVEAKAAGGRFSVSSTEFKAAGDTQVTSVVTSPVTTDIDTNIVPGVRRRLTVADLLGQGTLSGNAITYFVEGALEGDFATVAENAQKPQLHYADPTPVTEALKKIAAFIKESDEMIEDLPFLISAINNRLLYNLGLFEENQILSGSGVGTNLRGILNRVGVQTEAAAGAVSGADNADAVFRAITKVSTGSGLDADGIVINPADYQSFRLSKDANGQYFGGGFFGGEYGNGTIMVQPPLWGLRTVVTPAISAGTVLVGAFQQADTLYRKGGVRVESTNSNENDFTNNKVTVRAEERVALASRVPAGHVNVTLNYAAV